MGRGSEKPRVDKDLTLSTADAGDLHDYLTKRALAEDLAALKVSVSTLRSGMRDREFEEIERELADERVRKERRALGVLGDDEDDDLGPAERVDMTLGAHPRPVTLTRKLLGRLNGRTVHIVGSPLEDALNAIRPKTRGDCENSPRPCTWVGCKYALYLDVNPDTGSLKLNFPDLNPWDLDPKYSCALDIADDGGWPLERVGQVTNLTRERIRQYQVAAVKKLRQELGLGDLVVADDIGVELNVEDGDDSVVVNDEKSLAKASVAVLVEGGVDVDGYKAVEAAVVDVVSKKPAVAAQGEGDDVFDIGGLDV
ncbi:MAG: sigma factor-like helix-turn-helix DNA-binding protein [Candidatus Gracilibacteria bacterium]|jgi:hypothetical protein